MNQTREPLGMRAIARSLVYDGFLPIEIVADGKCVVAGPRRSSPLPDEAVAETVARELRTEMILEWRRGGVQ
jgi:hypothetical protein